MKELIQKIARQFIGIYWDDLTTAEKKVVDLLISAKYVKIVTEKNPDQLEIVEAGSAMPKIKKGK